MWRHKESPDHENVRRDYLAQHAALTQAGRTFVCVDESGFERTTQRDYGYALRDKAVHGSGLAGKKPTAPLLFEGTCDTDKFNIWLEQQLAPELKPGSVVVLDNATLHKSRATKEILENAKCDLLFLPPHSPDLMPIEKRFGNIKRHRKYNPDMPIDRIVNVYG